MSERWPAPAPRNSRLGLPLKIDLITLLWRRRGVDRVGDAGVGRMTGREKE